MDEIFNPWHKEAMTRAHSRKLASRRVALLAVFAALGLCIGTALAQAPLSTSPEALTFAVIGDYGTGNANESSVAKLVVSWNPALIITTGDDYYASAGGTSSEKYDKSTGVFYCRWLKDLSTTGTNCPVGLAATNAFFPALGNHDYSDAVPGPATYLAYFNLPGASLANSSGNERYYDVVAGPVHFFFLNSNRQEPDGTSSASGQGQWLQAQLAASKSVWNIVVFHHPPYSSDITHGSSDYMQWPFAAWGAQVVISGHAHTYERISLDGIVYFVNGLGGAKRYAFATPVNGSVVRYNGNWGAQKVVATSHLLVFNFFDINGSLIDAYSVRPKPVSRISR